jgi:hypothetical protein
MLEFNKYYIIQNMQYGTVMNLYGNHSGSVIPNGNQISLWPRSDSEDQQFMIVPYANGAKVVCKRNAYSHLLNRHSGNNSAIMWQTGMASVADSAIDFMTVNAGMNHYRIKLIQHNLYLTAVGSQSILYWQPLNGSNTQLFQLNETRHTIDMPEIFNQYYSSNITWVKNYGCALCCGIVLASWKHGINYTIANFDGTYDTVGNNGYSWTGPNNFAASAPISLTSISAAATIERIRNYVISGMPVACHFYKSNGEEHWVVAYSAYGSGTTWATSGIYVLDPYGNDSNSIYGRSISISDAMARKSFTAVDRIRIVA